MQPAYHLVIVCRAYNWLWPRSLQQKRVRKANDCKICSLFVHKGNNSARNSYLYVEAKSLFDKVLLYCLFTSFVVMPLCSLFGICVWLAATHLRDAGCTHVNPGYAGDTLPAFSGAGVVSWCVPGRDVCFPVHNWVPKGALLL